MLYGTKRLYNQTRSIKRGRKKLDPCLAELRERISAKMNVRPLNIVYDHIDFGGKRGHPRLNIILESEDDFNRLHRNPFSFKREKRMQILTLFAEVVTENGAKGRFDTDKVHLISDDFSAAAMAEAAQKMMGQHKGYLQSTFAEWAIWDIVGFWKVPVVFFMDEATKDIVNRTGVSERIREECYRLVKPFDEFDYFTPENFSILLDSKENLDENYEGSLYFYFK